eukprot:TRINITY_DN1576_c0_g1_i1.p1 TRINITY_DN1576_c0_g1~~TRINITY_DN1576_c0_g1_i1.p1  ORF type:complete len:296 (+),score=57.82 TRINITY_DN1576_c0_g1_i1:172-1059(+)
MSSFADEDQIAADEAIARRLQAEEGSLPLRFSLSGNAPVIAPARPVQQNVAQEMSDAQLQSPRVLAVFSALWLAELIASIIILKINWNRDCDKPLKLWLAVFSSRILFTGPVRVYYYLRLRANRTVSPSIIQTEKMVKVCTFVWFVFGQAWVYSSSTCSSTANSLYIYCLVLIIVIYVSMALPLLVLLGLCICLPCVLILLRFMGDGQAGASDNDIRNLPTKRYDPEEMRDAEGDRTTCVVCMADFERGEELRVLPCSHEFHTQCVDRWLKVKKDCPLCRRDIMSPSSQDASSPV